MKLTNEVNGPLFNTLPIGVLLVDKAGKIVMSNLKSEEILGFNEGELNGVSIGRLVPKRFDAEHGEQMKRFINSPSSKAMAQGRVLPALTKAGVEIEVEIGLSPLTVENSQYVLVSIIEITNQILKVAAFNDPLTGLPNRSLFKEKSKSLLDLAMRNKEYITLLFIDLDNFKLVNDQFGHAAGDALLSKVADLLRESTRKNDIVGRIGGDEFVMCLYGIHDRRSLKILVSHLIEKISNITSIDSDKVDISASIGAVFSNNISSLEFNELLKKADSLMYKAKKEGKGRFVLKEIVYPLEDSGNQCSASKPEQGKPREE